MPRKGYSIPPLVRSYLEELSDAVEEHGRAAIQSTEDFHFSYTQAYQYNNYYDGLRKEEQLRCIEHQLYEPDDSLFGWGPLGFHESIPIPLEFLPKYPPGCDDAERARIKKLRQAIPGRLEVHRREHPVASMLMILYRGLAGPYLVPGDLTLEALTAQKSRALQALRYKKSKNLWLLQNLERLRIEQKVRGVLVGIPKYDIVPF